jgi:hypothetical protein
MEKNEGILRQSFLTYRAAQDSVDDKVKVGGGKDE